MTVTTKRQADVQAGDGVDRDGKEVVLDVRNLKVYYSTPTGNVRAVDDVSFKVYKGEILGLVGESGCGKTTTAMAILRMVQPPGGIVGGQIMLDGIDLVPLGDAALRDVRWNTLALVPQGAMNSLNPVMRISAQIKEVIETHEGNQDKQKVKERILNLFTLVGLPSRIYDMYPHELSGGMKQRVCIAMAIALHPSLIIADEPTSALDVVVQRVVGQTLLDVKKRLGVSMIMIGHDMGLQAQLVDRLAVMYAGHMVEISPVETIFGEPLHPYTQMLIESIPSIKERKPLKLTEGLTHDLRNPPPGCIFQGRCPKVMLEHQVACHLYD
jgi:oligopeptide/dipeptide ABC transporter ATP-binding protein